MSKFLIVSTATLMGVFYAASGGPNFKAPEPAIAVIEPVAVPAQMPRLTAAAAALAEQEKAAALVAQQNAAAATALTTATAAPYSATPVVVETAKVTQASFATKTVPAAMAGDAAAKLDTDAPEKVYSVSGNRVNVRTGPGTDYGVIDTVPRGTLAEVLEFGADGWAQIRLLDSDRTGWMAARLLSES